MSFPFTHQRDAMDCGPACLQMVAKHYGKHYRLEHLRDNCFLTREGVSLLGISEASEKIGFRTTGVKITFEQLCEAPPCLRTYLFDSTCFVKNKKTLIKKFASMKNIMYLRPHKKIKHIMDFTPHIAFFLGIAMFLRYCCIVFALCVCIPIPFFSPSVPRAPYIPVSIWRLGKNNFDRQALLKRPGGLNPFSR
jgi:ABC-type bacteriocin/lantibiotic exporter with double-glycine peptidase domain